MGALSQIRHICRCNDRGFTGQYPAVIGGSSIVAVCLREGIRISSRGASGKLHLAIGLTGHSVPIHTARIIGHEEDIWLYGTGEK